MEPMIMAVLGVLVGGMVIAMYLPIFKLGQRFKSFFEPTTAIVV